VEPERADVDAVVSPSGDVVIPAGQLGRFSLVPGQHVTVTLRSGRRRQNMYGVLAGRLRDVDPEDIRRVRRETWGDEVSTPS
jgi:hypothetical protein